MASKLRHNPRNIGSSGPKSPGKEVGHQYGALGAKCTDGQQQVDPRTAWILVENRAPEAKDLKDTPEGA